MELTLPDELTVGASLRGNEFGWKLDTFERAITTASQLGYACYGGQFQFRLADGTTCEMYWVETAWCERTQDEPWRHFAARSCQESLNDFERLIRTTDFRREAEQFEYLRSLLDQGWNPIDDLVFVAYFETEEEWNRSESQQLSGEDTA